MEGTHTYPRKAVRPYLLHPAHGAPLLFTLAGCCDEEKHIQVEEFAEYARFVDRTAAVFLDCVKQGVFVSWFDDSMPHLDNAVDYAEQL